MLKPMGLSGGGSMEVVLEAWPMLVSTQSSSTVGLIRRIILPLNGSIRHKLNVE